MNLEGLRVLCALEGCDSISRAAKEVGLSPSTAWRRLNALEESLGCALIERTQQHTRLTEAGAATARRGRDILRQTEALAEEVQAISQGEQGVLRVALPIGGDAQSTSEGLMRWVQQSHGLRVVIHETPELCDPVRDDFDFVLTYHRPENSDLFIQQVARVEWRLFASRSYLEARGAPTRAEAILEHPLLMHQLKGDPPNQLPRLRGPPLPVRALCISTNPQSILDATARGLGLGYLPTRPMPERYDLVAVLPEVVGAERTLYLVAGLRTQRSPRLRLARDVIDWMTARLG